MKNGIHLACLCAVCLTTGCLTAGTASAAGLLELYDQAAREGWAQDDLTGAELARWDKISHSTEPVSVIVRQVRKLPARASVPCARLSVLGSQPRPGQPQPLMVAWEVDHCASPQSAPPADAKNDTQTSTPKRAEQNRDPFDSASARNLTDLSRRDPGAMRRATRESSPAVREQMEQLGY